MVIYIEKDVMSVTYRKNSKYKRLMGILKVASQKVMVTFTRSRGIEILE